MYFANAKSGSSTFLATLWNAADLKRGKRSFSGDPRNHAISPAQSLHRGTLNISDPAEVLEAVHFSVVRHPLVRLVSGYLDKIQRHTDNRTWRLFRHRYDLPRGARVSFPEFVELLAGDDPEQIDRHFRPQALNLACGSVRYAHIGQIENLSATKRFLKRHGVPVIRTHIPHKTSASEVLTEHLGDPAILRKALDVCERDFAAFNYAPGIETVAPLGPNKPPRADTTLYRKVLTVYAARHRGRAPEKPGRPAPVARTRRPRPT